MGHKSPKLKGKISLSDDFIFSQLRELALRFLGQRERNFPNVSRRDLIFGEI